MPGRSRFGAESPDGPAGLVSGSHELVEVAGPDAVSFLQGLLSQDLESMMPGAARRSFLLGPRGKLRALLWVWGERERVSLLADAG